MLTIEQSLHSIAIELHRLNKTNAQGVALLGQFVEIAVQNNKIVSAGNGPDLLRVVEKLVAPIGEMMAFKMSRPAAVTSQAGPVPPASVTKEGNGTRVEQQPEA